MAQRQLKQETTEDVATKSLADAGSIHTERTVKTSRGTFAEIQAEFDMALLDEFKPYHEGEKLPEPIVGVNKKGVRFMKKPAEPRFCFQGNDLVKIQRGLNGKKVSLFWTFKQVGKPETAQRDALHRKLRSYLRKRGIPGA